MYEEIFEPILTNEIVVNWIAPIITTILASIILTGIGKNILNEKIKNKIKVSNEKMLNAIRPFIIQQIPITQEMIISIRTAISIENKIKLKYLYNLEEMKNRLILDIAETRFLKEDDKTKLFKQINKIFLENLENDEIFLFYIYQDSESKYVETNTSVWYIAYMLIFFVVMAIFSFCDPTKIQNEAIKNIILFLAMFVIIAPIGYVMTKIFEFIMDGIKLILSKFIDEEESSKNNK